MTTTTMIKTVTLLFTLALLSTGSHAFVMPQGASLVKAARSSGNRAAATPLNLGVVPPSLDVLDHATSSLLSLSDSTGGPPPGEYSKLSYYTVLGLYLMSFPGLWSQIKRSTSAKIKRKTYVSPGEKSQNGGKDLRSQAGEIMAYMKANNYEVVEAGETITFRGLVQRSVSQAFFLVFCTALGMASLALVLQIQFQNTSIALPPPLNWFWLVLLSPYAGIYYWKSGDRVDDCSVKLSTNDEETMNEIVVQGNEDELERMWRTLEWQEKGMVKVEGILENAM